MFLASVFTHLLPDEVDNYLSEISRVLKPGGRCLCTYFLLNEESLSLIERAKGALDLKPGTNVYRVLDPENPNHAVRYDEGYTQSLYQRHGLAFKMPPLYGA